jgi:hypothetical protein
LQLGKDKPQHGLLKNHSFIVETGKQINKITQTKKNKLGTEHALLVSSRLPLQYEREEVHRFSV